MKFEWLFILKKIKKNKLVTALSVASLSLIISLIVMFLNTSSFFVNGATNFQRGTYGNSDINISISGESDTRFFSIDFNDFVDDELIKEKTEYIYGFFSTFVKVQVSEDTTLASIFVSDLDELKVYNKVIFDSGTVNYLGSDQILISKNFATENNLKVNDRIRLSFGDKSYEYEIIGIGLNQGIFLQGSAINNDIVMAPRGFSRINRLYIEGLVTHCVIKLIDSNDTKIVYEHLHDIIDSSLRVRYTIDKALIQSDLQVISVHVNFIVSISLVFCTIALMVLFRLFASKSKNDMQILEKIGVTKKRLVLIEGLFCFLITCIAMIFTLGIAQLITKSIVTLFPMFKGISLQASTFFIAYLVGLSISFISTVFATYMKKKPNKKNTIFDLVIGLTSVLILTILMIIEIKNSYLDIIICTLAVLSIINLCFIILNYGLRKLKNKYQNFTLLHCNHSINNPTSKKTFLFFLSSLIIILAMISIVDGVKDVSKKSSQIQPFDAIVANINNPSQDIIDKISSIEYVEKVEKTAIFLNEVVNVAKSTKKVAIFGLEESGFSNFASKDEFNELLVTPNGVVVSTIFMLQNNVKIGDIITTTINQTEYEMEVVGAIENDFLLGNFMLANVDFMSGKREYLHLALNITGGNQDVINDIYNQFMDKNFAIIDLIQMQENLQKSMDSFIDLLVYLIIIFSLIITATNGANIMLCQEINADFYNRLWRIGLSKQARTKESFISMLIGILFAAVVGVIISFIVVEIFNDIVIILSVYRFLTLDIWLCIGVASIFVLIALSINLAINRKADFKLN